MTKCGLITAAVFSFLMALIMVLHAVGVFWIYASIVVVNVIVALWFIVAILIILFLRAGGLELANSRSVIADGADGDDEEEGGGNKQEGEAQETSMATAGASALDETTQNDSTTHASDADNKESIK